MPVLKENRDEGLLAHMRKGDPNVCATFVTRTSGEVLILANDQLDAQILCFIISILQSSTCFEQRRAHHQAVKFY
jgi:hypothetical protein